MAEKQETELAQILAALVFMGIGGPFIWAGLSDLSNHSLLSLLGDVFCIGIGGFFVWAGVSALIEVGEKRK